MRYKIGFYILFCLSLFGEEHIYLPTPHLSRENILEIHVGVRPYRKTGIRLEAEVLRDKLIIHNYGYGGSGITLSLGGAKEVSDILQAHAPSSKIVAVLGAGVAGMTTAYDLLEQGYEVHLYADAWSPHLTSDVAGGIWSPPVLPEDASEEKKQLYQRLLETSRERFLMSTGKHPEFAGVCWMDGYSFRTASFKEAIKTKHRGEEVIVHFDNGLVKTGRKIHELEIEGKVFMEDLYSQVKAKGAVLMQRHFETLEEILSLEEPTIINCTSMGSRTLFNDSEFLPVRGQLIHFKQQEGINFLFYENVPDSEAFWVSIYPWSDRILLGGVYEPGEEELTIDQSLIDKIIANAEKSLSGQW